MSLRTAIERTDFFELGRALVLGFFEGIGRVLDALGGTRVDVPGPLAIEAQRAYESAHLDSKGHRCFNPRPPRDIEA